MVSEKLFGKTIEGKEITLYTLTNENGMKAEVMNYGAILVSLYVPNKDGELKDVVLGYDRLKDYFVNGSCFGATIGPVANRTEKACFELDGTLYNLLVNDNDNNLHSDGNKGLHKTVWKAEADEQGNAVTFTVACKDGYLGFPGNREFSVTYKLSQDNALEIHYEGQTDKTTLMNLTNHSYFNLKGQECEQTIEDEKVMIKASYYTPVRMGAIPLGKIEPVKGTPFDFTQGRVIKTDIDADNKQLGLVGGYDHNFVLDEYEEGKVQKVATLSDETAKRTMEVYTDLPGIQLYTGNSIVPELGKGDVLYVRRGGVCFETQYFPNCANEKNFIKPVVTADKPFTSTTIYKFI